MPNLFRCGFECVSANLVRMPAHHVQSAGVPWARWPDRPLLEKAEMDRLNTFAVARRRSNGRAFFELFRQDCVEGICPHRLANEFSVPLGAILLVRTVLCILPAPRSSAASCSPAISAEASRPICASKILCSVIPCFPYTSACSSGPHGCCAMPGSSRCCRSCGDVRDRHKICA